MPVPATDEEEAPAPPPNARVPVDPAQEGDGDNQVAAPVGAKLPAPLGLIAHPAAVQEEDPRIRRYKAMQAVQTKLKSDFEQDHPFAPSGSYDPTRNASPEIRTGRSLARDSSGRIHVRDDTERVLTGALKDSDAQAKERAIADRRAALEAKRIRNDPRRAQAAGTGQRTRVDEWGETQAVLDPDGKPLYHVGQWEEGLHPDTKLPVLQRRGHHGEVETKHPLISASPNLSDPGAYYKAQDGTYQPYGDKSLEELKNHPDFAVARMAYRATTARNAAIHKEALAGMYQDKLSAEREFDVANEQYDRLARKSADQKALIAGEMDPIKQAGLQASLDETMEQMADLDAKTKPRSKSEQGGSLWLAQQQAQYHYKIAQHDQQLQSFADSAAEIHARIKAGQALPGDDKMQGLIGAAMAKNTNDRAETERQANEGRQGAPPQPPAPPQSKQDESLTQSEPATLFAKGVKNIGEVSVQEMARRYGSGTGEVQPASLLKIAQRSKDIDETLKASGTNISPELSKSLTAERTYLGRLYAQRFARLAPDVQKRVADATREPTNWEITKANVGKLSGGLGLSGAFIIEGTAKLIARSGALTQPGGAAMMLSGIDNPVVEQIDQYAKWEKEAIAASHVPENEAEAKAQASMSAQISGAVGEMIPYALPVARVARLGVAAEAAISGVTGALGIGQSFRDEATRGLQDQLDAKKITQEQFKTGQNQAEGIGTVIGAGMMLPFSGFARAMGRTPAGRVLVSTITEKLGLSGEEATIKWLGGPKAQELFRNAMKGGAGGATTGFGQAVATNMAARGDFGNVAYDEKRGLFEGAGEGGATLGLLGAIHSAMLKGEGRIPGVPEGKEPGAPKKPVAPKEAPAKSKGELAEEAEKAAAPAEKTAPARDIVQEPTTPAQKSALAIHQGLKEAEALRAAPEGGKLLKAQLGKESKDAPADELKAVAQARAEQEPPPSTDTKPTELAAVGKAGEAASAERAGREIAGAGVSPEAQGRAEIAAREAAPVNIGPRDSTVSTGTGVPTAKEKTMLAEQQRLVDEHLKGGEPESPQQARAKKAINKMLQGAAIRARDESIGQNILDHLEERGTTPRDVVQEFWDKTYGTLSPDQKTQIEKYIGREAGLKPGDTISVDPKGEKVAAKDWRDVYPPDAIGGEVHQLEGSERGLISLMAAANEARTRIQPTEKPTHALPVEKSGPLPLQPAPENSKGVRQENPVAQGAAGAQAVRPEGKGAVSEAVKVQQAGEQRATEEGRWQRLMKASPEQAKAVASEYSPEQAQKAIDRLNAAPGDNPTARAALQERIEPPPKAEPEPVPVATGKEPTPPAQMKPAERVAELQAAGIKEVNGKPLTGPESANAAEIINAVGKLRKGKPDLAEPVKNLASVAKAIRAAKIYKAGSGELHSATPATPFVLAYDGALEIAATTLEAGQKLADAIQKAINHFKEKYPQASAFALKRLEHDITEAHGKAQEEGAKAVAPQPSVSGAAAKPKTPASKLAGKVSQAVRAVVGKSGDPMLRDEISARRDAGDNFAGVRATEGRSEIEAAVEKIAPRSKMERAVKFFNVPGRGRTAFDIAEEAIRPYIESGGDKGKLTAMKNKILSSKHADQKWAKQYVEAIDYAINNGEKMEDASGAVRQNMRDQLEAETEANLPVVERKNYVPRYQDVDEQAILEPRGGTGSGMGEHKVREYETMADSIAAGVKPKSLSTIDSVSNRLNSGMRAVGIKRFYGAMKDAKTPEGNALVVEPKKIERANDTAYYEAPEGYKLLDFAGKKMAIQKEYEPLVKALTDPSFFSQSKAGRALMKVVAGAKSVTLLLDTFHLGRVAGNASALNASHPIGWTIGPRYSDGLTIYEHSPRELARMARDGEIPKEQLSDLIEKKRTLEAGIREGYNTGRVEDAIHQDFLHNLPGFGGINKFIFQKFQRGAMSEAFILEFNRQKVQNPGLSESQVARKVATELNTKFGNIGRQGWIKSATGRDLARLLFLAPQWNEGLIKSEARGAGQLVKGATNWAHGKPANVGSLGRSLATMAIGTFAAAQIINQTTRGKFTWENPEEGWEAKISGWIPDKLGGSAGYFFNPVGIAAETSHILAKGYERGSGGALPRAFNAIRDYARSRESALAKPIDTFALREDYLGRSIKPDDVPWEVAKSALPAPISGGSAWRVAKGILTGGTTEKFPGEFQKQAMQSFGLRTDKAPSPEQRIYGLAHEFNRAHGKEDHAGGEVSDYKELTDAVRRGNEGNIKDAIDTLLEKRSAEDLEKYYRLWQKRTFTGSHKNEAAFILTLNPEQKQQYMKARAERVRLGGLALKAIQAIPAGKRAGPFAPALVP